MTIEINHDLPVELAALKIKNGAENLFKQYSDKVNGLNLGWNGHAAHLSGQIQGLKVAVILVVFPGKVVVQGQIPSSLFFFKKKISNSVRQTVIEMLR